MSKSSLASGQLGSTTIAKRLPATIKDCSLAQAIAYQNHDVVYKFMEQYETSFDEANDIFLETKKWLWLCCQPEARKSPLRIVEPLLILDEMWHTFILFTKEYTDYCLNCYGTYLHHAPTTQSEKEQQKQKNEENSNRAVEEQNQEMYQQYVVILDKLGQDTLLKWFVEYPARYEEFFFNHRRKSKTFKWKPESKFQALVSHLKSGRKVVIRKK